MYDFNLLATLVILLNLWQIWINRQTYITVGNSGNQPLNLMASAYTFWDSSLYTVTIIRSKIMADIWCCNTEISLHVINKTNQWQTFQTTRAETIKFPRKVKCPQTIPIHCKEKITNLYFWRYNYLSLGLYPQGFVNCTLAEGNCTFKVQKQ